MAIRGGCHQADSVFLKNDLLRFPRIFLLLTQTHLGVLQCAKKLELRLICVQIIMINFDLVDFSERRSEEVISSFGRSVYSLPFPSAYV